jgi:hypothetical protein
MRYVVRLRRARQAVVRVKLRAEAGRGSFAAMLASFWCSFSSALSSNVLDLRRSSPSGRRSGIRPAGSRRFRSLTSSGCNGCAAFTHTRRRPDRSDRASDASCAAESSQRVETGRTRAGSRRSLRDVRQRAAVQMVPFGVPGVANEPVMHQAESLRGRHGAGLSAASLAGCEVWPIVRAGSPSPTSSGHPD